MTKTVEPVRCAGCGEQVDVYDRSVLASGFQHVLCRHPRWKSAALVASAAGGADALALKLWQARQTVAGWSR